jgi:calcium permeable stress-gated cation channel
VSLGQSLLTPRRSTSIYTQVYQVIAPISSFVLGFSFIILRPACLHQFVYIYGARPDSGGVIWANFIKIILMCMLIAQFTIVGLLGLKQAAIAIPLMFRKSISYSIVHVYAGLRVLRVSSLLAWSRSVYLVSV